MNKEDNLPDIRKHKDLLEALHLAENIVYKTYLEDLNNLEIECSKELEDRKLHNIAQFFRLEKFVYERNENNRDKLVSIFHSVASANGSIIVLIINNGEKIEFYIGTKILNDQNSSYVLEKTFKGNFPGSIITPVNEGDELNSLAERLFGINDADHKKQCKHVCTITGVAGLRAKEESKERQFVQGIEKLIDAMREESYSLILLADPLNSDQINVIRRGYENLYSQLVTFATTELNYGQNESKSVSDSISEGLSKSISDSISDTISHTDGFSQTGGVNAGIGIPFGGPHFGMNYSYSRNKSDTISYGTSKSLSRVISSQGTKTDSKSEGESRNIQIKFEDKTIKNLLERIDIQLKRLNASSDTGMWNCSVYCLADLSRTAKMVASAYLSLLRGENSSVETGTITKWTDDERIIAYLKKMYHPRLRFEDKIITPASLISGSELSIHAGIPQKSVGGLPVLEIAPFGREVITQNSQEESETITLGKIFHMGEPEKLPVCLNKNSLSSHTFITGSTGSGKSNTIYQILNEIDHQNVRFMVIEPAKGEYKQVFGGRENVAVYGTNPKKSQLLRINPFKFPEDIHILEHLDRLVEIFNVCWPMYAAMPAVLKDSIEAAYMSAGWDLRTSQNRFTPALYPTFKDVVINLVRVMDSSAYSDELKGNYKGSLETRLKSLTNGINGMIFVNDDIPAETLFDANVIIDLSRVGSMETKALIMGLLVMKLQEYRMTSGKMNSPLKHITVLEEAHNLLKRTSTEQSNESSNLLGKSVEMLANAIAEMRTYGEGFIIADQSPGLLDMSVIRNTNTKIILRLPDQSDRELVGKAAGLNNDQINELSKLQCGVAAVYQNEWVQPVLCKIDRFKMYPETLYNYNDKNAYKEFECEQELDVLKKRIIRYLLSAELDEKSDENIDDLKNRIINASLMSGLKVKLFDILSERKKCGLLKIGPVISSLFDNGRDAFTDAEKIRTGDKLDDWVKYIKEHLTPSIDDLSESQKITVLQCIIQENCLGDSRLKYLGGEFRKFILQSGGIMS